MTFVVRSEHFFRFFFQPVHLHGELAYLLRILGFLASLAGELFFEVVFALVVEDDAGLVQELFFPIAKQIGLELVVGGQRVEIFLALEQLDDEVGFEFGSEMTTCT